MHENLLFEANLLAVRALIIAAVRQDRRTPAAPSAASIRRVAEYIADTPAEFLRTGITPESVAADMLAAEGRQPSQLRKADFDTAFADAAFAGYDTVDDIREAVWTVDGIPA